MLYDINQGDKSLNRLRILKLLKDKNPTGLGLPLFIYLSYNPYECVHHLQVFYLEKMEE